MPIPIGRGYIDITHNPSVAANEHQLEDPSHQHVHDDSPACFRCYDGTMKNKLSGEIIPNDCDTCHAILIAGTPTEPDLTKRTMPSPAPSAEAPQEAK